MVQEGKLLKTIISKQSGCKSELTYNFIHKTQNMLSILNFLIDDLVSGKNVDQASSDVSRIFSQYENFLTSMKIFCHQNGRLYQKCNLCQAIDFMVQFKKIHLREQKVLIENEVDPGIVVSISPYDMAYGLDELLPLLADSQSTLSVTFRAQVHNNGTTLYIGCDTDRLNADMLQLQIAKSIFELANCSFEIDGDGIVLQFCI